jgi:hypothetical protein
MSLVEELLKEAAPKVTSAADWQDVLRRSTPSGRRGGNPIVAIAVLVVIVAIAVPAIALSTTVQRLVGFGEGGGPVAPQARLILEAPAGDDVVVRLYSAPSSQGGECEFIHYAKAGAPVDVPQPNGAGWCRNDVGGTQSHADQSPRSPAFTFSVSVSPTPVAATLRRDSTGPHVVISGSVAPNLQAASVKLEGPSRSESLHFIDNHFLTATDSIYRPRPNELPIDIVAYDAQGREVARERIPFDSLDPDA